MPERLTTSAGLPIAIDEGESLNLKVTLRDTDDNIIDAASVATLTLTLFNESDNAIINNWNDKNIKNANNATISGGVVTVRLDAADNPLVGTKNEYHVARIKFTWSDGTSTRTGLKEVRFLVRDLVTPTA